MIKGYHTDNGIFNASEFTVEMLKKQQKMRFSGAGDSHKNEAAERATKTVVTIERTMVMYAVLRCPKDILSTYLWPVAIYYAVWTYNRIPDIKYRLSVIDIWSR